MHFFTHFSSIVLVSVHMQEPCYRPSATKLKTEQLAGNRNILSSFVAFSVVLNPIHLLQKIQLDRIHTHILTLPLKFQLSLFKPDDGHKALIFPLSMNSKGTHSDESSTCLSNPNPNTKTSGWRRRRRRHSSKSPASKNASGSRLRVSGRESGVASSVSLLQYWKQDGGAEADRQRSNEGSIRSSGYGSECGSARSIGAGLWHFQLEAAAVPVSGRGGTVGGVTALLTRPRNLHAESKYLHSHRHCDEERNPSLSFLRKYPSWKVEPPLMLDKLATITKWVPAGSSEIVFSTCINPPISPPFGPVFTASSLQAKLVQARIDIHGLEANRRSSRKKIHRFLTQLGVENALWKKTERRKMDAVVDDLKDALSEEKRYCQTMVVVNSRLNKKLLDAKSSANECMKAYEEEKKGKELMEEVCSELAKKVGANKTEIKSLRKETARMYEELEAERKMLQLAEVWREERVRMKFVEAKSILEGKYSRVQELVGNIEAFMRSRRPDPMDVMEIEGAKSTMDSSRKFEKVKEVGRLSRKLGDLFSNNIDECRPDVEADEGRDIKPYPIWPFDGTRGLDYKSCAQDPRLNHSLPDPAKGFSVRVVSESRHRPANFGRQGDEAANSCDSGITTELCCSSLSSSKQSKKKMPVGSLSIQGSQPDINFNEGTTVASGRDSGDSCIHDDLFMQYWRSPSELENPPTSQGKTGCMEWPRSVQRSRLKAKLLEAQVESEKSQLCRVLQQIN